VQDTNAALGKSGAVRQTTKTLACSLYTDQADGRLVDEGSERANSVTAATDTGNDRIGEATHELYERNNLPNKIALEHM